MLPDPKILSVTAKQFGLMVSSKNICFCISLFLMTLSLQAYEKQLTLSSFMDSNPRESIFKSEPTPGLKVKALIRFNESQPSGQFYGSLLGQGLIEPALFLDSKIILNAELGRQFKLHPRLSLNANVRTFQKLYFYELQRSARTSLSAYLSRSGSRSVNQEIGYTRADSRYEAETEFRYFDHELYARLSKSLNPKLQLEIKGVAGRIDYLDYPIKTIENDSLIFSNNINQQDDSWLLGLHITHTGQLIWGVSVSYKDIRSNSFIDDAQIWGVKLYASSRIGERLFAHVVLQGMNKRYDHSKYISLNSYRDPEENIQNQVHIQVERMLSPEKVIYLQYSYFKNETVLNHWFYSKNLIETGLKFDL